MAPVSNTPSLENLNGSARSGYSNGSYKSITLGWSTASRVAGSAHQRNSTNRNHTYPAPIARDYQYADNSAAGYNTYHGNRSLAQAAVTYHEPTTFEEYFTTSQVLSSNQTYLLPEAPPYTTGTYDSELDLDDDPAENAAAVTNGLGQDQPGEDQQSVEREYAVDKLYDYTSNDTHHPSDPSSESYPSQPTTEFGGDRYYINYPSTPPRREIYNVQPRSPTLERFLRADSPEEKIRLGLPRDGTIEQQGRAYELAYGTTRRH
ncbi:hypothetical protein EG329_006421 [Mollisiaceae sp. DMI_Dod_QoI]|nr:hypothetical protein EG329_006421 [Helotiales sp. DMI_Dod_QoI]